jgi:hypothetical protein
MPTEEPGAPLPGAARRLVGLLLALGVGVGAGLAPLLGMKKIPYFSALVELLPPQLEEYVIPASAFLMGLVAVAVQFSFGEVIARKSLRRRFFVAFLAVLLGFLALVTLRSSYVKSVPDWNEPVVIGWSRLPYSKDGKDGCGCPKGVSDEECIASIAFQVSRCWDSGGVKLSLVLSYLLAIGGFGGLIGLLVLQEEAQRRQRRQSAARRRKGTARKGKAPGGESGGPGPEAPPEVEDPGPGA